MKFLLFNISWTCFHAGKPGAPRPPQAGGQAPTGAQVRTEDTQATRVIKNTFFSSKTPPYFSNKYFSASASTAAPRGPAAASSSSGCPSAGRRWGTSARRGPTCGGRRGSWAGSTRRKMETRSGGRSSSRCWRAWRSWRKMDEYALWSFIIPFKISYEKILFMFYIIVRKWKFT